MVPLRNGVFTIFLVSLYLCQINADLYETLNLSSLGINNHHMRSTLGWLPKMAPSKHLVVPMFLISLYPCQIHLDHYESLNIRYWDTNNYSKRSTLCGLS